MTTLIGLYLAGFVLTVAVFRHVWDTRLLHVATAKPGEVWARTIVLSLMWPGFWVIAVVPPFRRWVLEDTPPRPQPPTQWTEDRL